jgi:peptidyl-prolyl cis-trans isomerase SDCCAG10
MANNGTKNSNDSQFIITLGSSSFSIGSHTSKHGVTDRADELHGKHTLFGRVIGDTVYSAYQVYTIIPGSDFSCKM